MIKVSFIIPAFNAEATITECLKSILKQSTTVFDSEIIVVNNCSTDSTVQKIEAFLPRIKIINENRKSRACARQAGIEASSGEFVVFVDADTELTDQWTLINLEQMFVRPQVGAIQGKIEPLIEKKWHRLLWYHSHFRTFGTFNLLSIVGTKIIPVIDTAASIWRREAIKEGFNKNLNRAEDIDLTMRVLYAGYSLAGTTNTLAMVRWDKSLISWFKRFYEQASSERIVYSFWGAPLKPINVRNIFQHPLWPALPIPAQIAELLITLFHKKGFYQNNHLIDNSLKPSINKQNSFCQTFIHDNYYLGENIRSIFLNEYIALLNIKTFKCYWVHEDETKWNNKLKEQLVAGRIIIPRKTSIQS